MENAADPPPHKARLVMFPGLGADGRLFEPQREQFPDLHVPRWPELAPGESLEDFGARLAPSVRGTSGEPLYVGGASFGGVVALEVARHVAPRAVFLVGSCRSPAAIPPAFRLMGNLARHLPNRVFGLMKGLAPLGAGMFGAETAGQREGFVAQLAGADPAFLRWGVHALMKWSPARLDCPVFQIHGGRDRILPVGRASPDKVIPGAGHLLNITHAAEVNAFILERIRA